MAWAVGNSPSLLLHLFYIGVQWDYMTSQDQLNSFIESEAQRIKDIRAWMKHQESSWIDSFGETGEPV